MPAPNDRTATPVSPQVEALSSITLAGLWLRLLLGGSGLLALILLVAVNDPGLKWSFVPTVVVMLLGAWWFGFGKVVVDHAGVRVYGGGVLKMLNVKPVDVDSAVAKEINPMEYGGWGLRSTASGTAFILRKGPGLVVNRKQRKPLVYSVASMADAQLMATRINQLTA
ncbi:hypothetical protein [Arthrobacter cryoconiti]|uniref:Bacterial Pleckstrin homology domain-containing protein n=1 Tax=Arthrobacter cryoconiti TaxID=748907 RepID=A0ABV8R2Y8_9MICC|nr:hypothetical protein [Arthrobacter cryoconiti]MCC9068670.1 hypothetical protein [Arthrobacter cryoconiti]